MIKIVVTGGAGYIGSNTVEQLVKSGKYQVWILDNLSTGYKKLLNPKAKFVKVDMLDLPKLQKVFAEVKPEIVIHFAGVSQVGESNRDPEKYYQNNVVGGTRLLKAMVENGCKKIIFSSSAATYGEPKEIPITENHSTKPINVYGQTKLSFEKILKNFEKKDGLKFLALRYFNAGGASESYKYGELHEPETHLIPNILKALKNGSKFSLFGGDYKTKDGTCVRDYIHVYDLAKAHVLGVDYLRKKNAKSEIVNLGTGKGYTVKEIVDVCLKVTGKKLNLKIEERRPGDPAVLVASFAKAKKLLKWRPVKTIKDIVESAWRFEKKK